jgi:hypothetical protein
MKRLITTFLFLAATSGLTAEVVENFDNYFSGNVSDAFDTGTGGTENTNAGTWNQWYKWNGSGEQSSGVVVIGDNSGDKFLSFGYTSGIRSAYRDLGLDYDITHEATGSFEFSFFVKSHNNNIANDLYYGIGHESSPENGINSFVAGINLQHDSGTNELKLRAFNGSGTTDYSSGTYEYDTWYHAALSIDYTDATGDTYSVYVVKDSGSLAPPASHVGYGPAILTDQSFNANSSTGDESLSTFMVFDQGISANSHAYLDNVGYSDSLIPEVDNFALLIGLGLLTACITNRKLSVRP